MAQLINVDTDDLNIFDRVYRVLTIRSTTQSSPTINQELIIPRRRLIHPASGVSHVSVEGDCKSTSFVLENSSQAVLTEASERLSIDEQSADAILVILESVIT